MNTNLTSGRNINGYVLETLLSEANNLVWSAYDPSVEREVVLKFIKDKRAADRERSLMVDIDHPNIIKLLGVFDHECFTVLVIEFKQGRNLRNLYEHLHPEEALTILLDVGSAIQAIHNAGFWHGDISHLNIIYSVDRRQAYLIDFSYEGKCAPGFHAPEDLVEGDPPIDQRTDLFRFAKLIELLREDLADEFIHCLSVDPALRPDIEWVMCRLRGHKKPRRRLSLLAVAGLLFATAFLTWWRSPLHTEQTTSSLSGGRSTFHQEGRQMAPSDYQFQKAFESFTEEQTEEPFGDSVVRDAPI